MRTLWRILKVLLLAAISLLVLVVAGALLVFLRPEVLINSKNANWAMDYARKRELLPIEVRWEQIDLQAKSESFFKKKLELRLEGLCVAKLPQEFRGCFDHVELAASMDFTGFSFKLTELGPVDILGRELAIQIPEGDGPAPKEAEGSPLVPSWLEKTVVSKVLVEIRGFEARNSEFKVAGKLSLENDPEATGQSWKLAASERLQGLASAAHRATLELSGRTEGRDFSGALELRGKTRAFFDDGKDVTIALDLEKETDASEAGFQVDASLVDGPRLVTAHTRGEIGPDRFRAKLGAIGRGLHEYAPRVALEDCEVGLTRVKGEASRGDLRLSCPIGVKLKIPPVQDIPDLKIPTDTVVRIAAQLQTSYPPSPDARMDGSISAKLDPILTPVLEGEARVAATLHGAPSELPKQGTLETQIGARVRIPKFQEIVRRLRGTAWAVPAPFNTLSGDIEVGAQGVLDLQGGNVPLYLRTRLASTETEQSLQIRGDGNLELKPNAAGEMSADLKAKVALADVKLALPRLELQAPPRLVPDSRIRVPEKQAGGIAAGEPRFTYSFQIVTPDSRPLRLISNLAKAPVPIRIDLSSASDTPMSGLVQVQKFPVEVFRRKAEVERFNVALGASDEMKIDGSIRVAFTDYTVWIKLFGTSKEPKVKLASEPPLPEEQLVSVLLFGKSPEDLDAAEVESVGSTQAALADQAVSLASLYVLASTPVESIGYDPSTRGFSAKVRLGEGTSLNVGTAEGSLGHIGIRRRLGRSWTISTDLANPSDPTNTEGGAVSATLEWSRRY